MGYGDGGLLTEAVRRRPYAVVLLDEVEKAHPDVMQLFYQVFDKGVLTDGEGTPVSFRNTVILLTSNLGSDITQALCVQAQPSQKKPSQEELIQALRPVLTRHFQPALLARMRIVPYVSLDRDVIADIAALKLQTLAKRVADNNGMLLHTEPAVATWLAERCTQTDTGARNIDAVLAGTILPVLARNILQHMADDSPADNVRLGMENGQLTLDFFAAGTDPAMGAARSAVSDTAAASPAAEAEGAEGSENTPAPAAAEQTGPEQTEAGQADADAPAGNGPADK